MNDLVEVTTQAQLDKAVADGDIPVCRNGFFSVGGSASVEAFDSASVWAFGSASVRASGSASVEAFDFASVEAFDFASVWAFGSASVRAFDSASVRAFGSASVRASDSASVEASDSASVRAFGSASVRAFGSASVEAGKFVAVTRHGDTANINGGVLIQIPPCDQPAEWCDFHDLPVKRGKVVLFKAVDDNLKSGHGLAYPIGESVEAQDFTDQAVCGGGLHLSPRPFMARRYFAEATRFLACEVALKDLVVIADSRVSDKAKARRLRVLHEVDVDGEPLVAEAVAA